MFFSKTALVNTTKRRNLNDHLKEFPLDNFSCLKLNHVFSVSLFSTFESTYVHNKSVILRLEQKNLSHCETNEIIVEQELLVSKHS